MTLQLFEYTVEVYDPEDDVHVMYKFRAPSDRAAEVEARHAYTGLLGDPDKLGRIRSRLELKITRNG